MSNSFSVIVNLPAGAAAPAAPAVAKFLSGAGGCCCRATATTSCGGSSNSRRRSGSAMLCLARAVSSSTTRSSPSSTTTFEELASRVRTLSEEIRGLRTTTRADHAGKSRTDLLVALAKVGVHELDFARALQSGVRPRQVLDSLRGFSDCGCLCLPVFRRAFAALYDRDSAWYKFTRNPLDENNYYPPGERLRPGGGQLAASTSSSSSTCSTLADRVSLLAALARQRARVLVPGRLGRELFSTSDFIGGESDANGSCSPDHSSAAAALSVLRSCAFLRLPVPPCVAVRLRAAVSSTPGAGRPRRRAAVDETARTMTASACSSADGQQSGAEFLAELAYSTLVLYHAQADMDDLCAHEKVGLRDRTAGTERTTAGDEDQDDVDGENLNRSQLSVQFVVEEVLPMLKFRLGAGVDEESCRHLSDRALTQMYVVRNALRYLHPETLNDATSGHAAASEHLKQLLQRVHEEWYDRRVQASVVENSTSASEAEAPAPSCPAAASTNERAAGSIPSRTTTATSTGTTPTNNRIRTTRFTATVDWSLTKLRIAHSVNAWKGPFLVDVLERDRNCVYRLLKQDVMLAESLRFTTGPRVLEKKTLQGMGYRVIDVPYWHWNKLRLRKPRIEYLRMSRHLALFDPRNQFLAGAGGSRHINRGLEYVGERFGEKDVPNNAFAWFKPREARPLAE